MPYSAKRRLRSFGGNVRTGRRKACSHALHRPAHNESRLPQRTPRYAGRCHRCATVPPASRPVRPDCEDCTTAGFSPSDRPPLFRGRRSQSCSGRPDKRGSWPTVRIRYCESTNRNSCMPESRRLSCHSVQPKL